MLDLVTATLEDVVTVLESSQMSSRTLVLAYLGRVMSDKSANWLRRYR